MDRDTQDGPAIDLGAASVETRGPGTFQLEGSAIGRILGIDED